MAYMAGQLGGYGILRFTKRDLNNYVHSQRIAQINNGDAVATISYLEGKANANMMMVAKYTKTAEDRLGSLFWADGQMIADYQLFGDVLAFDATYQSNKYKKPLVVFSGSNHHKQTAIFGFALLKDEEVWFLQSTNILLELVLNLDRVVKDYRNNEDAKKWTAIATDGTEGHGTWLPRYDALCSAMSVVAKLVSDDIADFAVVRDAITSLAHRLHGRRGNMVEHEAGVRQQSGPKDPCVARTKGAPKHGRITESST
ncbi:hypothetical protein AHAS_Ahas13G0397000 [Arachis hypogaea]